MHQRHGIPDLTDEALAARIASGEEDEFAALLAVTLRGASASSMEASRTCGLRPMAAQAIAGGEESRLPAVDASLDVFGSDRAEDEARRFLAEALRTRIRLVRIFTATFPTSPTRKVVRSLLRELVKRGEVREWSGDPGDGGSVTVHLRDTEPEACPDTPSLVE